MTDLKPPEVFNEKLNEMAEEYVEHCISNGHSVNGISAAYCKADFKAGFQAALYLPEVKAIVDELRNSLNYIHWNADDLTGDDLVGDGSRTKHFEKHVRNIEQALEKIKGMGLIEKSEGDE